jgi:hypothetical protein
LRVRGLPILGDCFLGGGEPVSGMIEQNTMNMEPPNNDFAAWLRTVNRQMPTTYQADDAPTKWAYAGRLAGASETERREGDVQLTNVRVTFWQSSDVPAMPSSQTGTSPESRSKEYQRTDDDAINAARDIRLFLENEVFPTDTIVKTAPD